MEQRSVEAVLTALNEAKVRYLVVGGLAVVAHGYVRGTRDVDLAIDMERDNLLRAIAALQQLRYRPRAPVPFEDFADAAKRSQWIREKHMVVFSVVSDDHRATVIDIFAECPFDFADEARRALRLESNGVEVPVVAYATLVAMKRAAGRPQDLVDVEQLRKVRGEGGHG